MLLSCSIASQYQFLFLLSYSYGVWSLTGVSHASLYISEHVWQFVFALDLTNQRTMYMGFPQSCKMGDSFNELFISFNDSPLYSVLLTLTCMTRIHSFRKAFVKNFTAINSTSHENHGAARKANLPKERITYKIFILFVKLQRHAIMPFWKDLK